jgi:hypothetical protein
MPGARPLRRGTEHPPSPYIRFQERRFGRRTSPRTAVLTPLVEDDEFGCSELNVRTEPSEQTESNSLDTTVSHAQHLHPGLAGVGLVSFLGFPSQSIKTSLFAVSLHFLLFPLQFILILSFVDVEMM